jgi:hypothetical protein
LFLSLPGKLFARKALCQDIYSVFSSNVTGIGLARSLIPQKKSLAKPAGDH